MRRSRVLAIVILVAGALGVAVLAFRLGNATRIEHYSVVDDDTIVVRSTTGDLSWTRVTRVVETADSVDITVRTFQLPLPVADIGYPIDLVVDLQEPLGDRRVLDRSAEVPAAP